MHSAFSSPRWMLLAGLLMAWPGLLSAAPAPAAAGPIPLELNKLAPLPGSAAGCRAYFVITNPGSEAISELQVDLVLFGKDGIISGRVTLGLGPVPGNKTVVRLFDLAATSCDSIGHILLNDVLACRIGTEAAAPSEQEREACLDRIAVSSLAKVPLTK